MDKPKTYQNTCIIEMLDLGPAVGRQEVMQKPLFQMAQPHGPKIKHDNNPIKNP